MAGVQPRDNLFKLCVLVVFCSSYILIITGSTQVMSRSYIERCLQIVARWGHFIAKRKM